jgi:hypothetical protein
LRGGGGGAKSRLGPPWYLDEECVDPSPFVGTGCGGGGESKFVGGSGATGVVVVVVVGTSGGRGGNGCFSGGGASRAGMLLVLGVVVRGVAGETDTGCRSTLLGGVGGLMSAAPELRLLWKLSGCAAVLESRPGKALLSVPPTGWTTGGVLGVPNRFAPVLVGWAGVTGCV